MAETLLALLLVTSSAKGCSLVYRWPPSPSSSTRLIRPKPIDAVGSYQFDNPWRAAQSSDADTTGNPTVSVLGDEDEEYEWKKPEASRDRSASFSRSNASHPASGRNSPSNDDGRVEDALSCDGYNDLLGYSTEFLASLLCPQGSLCHQKFELIVDDLAFIGHPVCAEPDGVWRFKPEKFKQNSARGRGARTGQLPQVDETPPRTPGPDENDESDEKHRDNAAWLQTFHFVMVMDLPNPSSSATGNVARYFDVIYEQLAFTICAVLFQEQVLANFVETECEKLGTLKDECINKGEPFTDYMSKALRVSSIAPAMKTLYEGIKASTMAYITLHGLPLELQLPPHLDALLHAEEEQESEYLDYADDHDQDGGGSEWGRAMGPGWRLAALAPWKALLLLDEPGTGSGAGVDPYGNLRGPHVGPEDRGVAEGLVKFLETASIMVPLADMASELDWDLETQVYPTVRWLVQHRRATVVDAVHPGLKTVFVLPAKFDIPLSKFSADFAATFGHRSVPPLTLPGLLATISAADNNHFFGAVVHSKDRERVEIFHDVVLWMLRRDLLVTLHLRVRIVATTDLKLRVRVRREHMRASRASAGSRNRSGERRRRESGASGWEREGDGASEGPGDVAWLSLSPRSARRHSRRVSGERSRSHASDRSDEQYYMNGDTRSDEDDGEEEEEEEDSGEETEWDPREDSVSPSMVSNPGRATPLERRWLSAMSEGKNAVIVKRFDQINQYFDGRCTDDEILFCAEITRKQLREVLHHYEEYLQTFLHPS